MAHGGKGESTKAERELKLKLTETSSNEIARSFYYEISSGIT